ncbi:MAG: TonB-dependent receptor [Arcobacteraceae bacterium]|nr:TonB-dependent receptor [Arcobacteraceae bacterium]
MNTKRLLFGLSVVCANFLFANDTVKLDDVSVSANKIEENIKDVPQSITVIDEEILAEKGIKTINDVVKEVPNMITSGSNNGVQTSFRGLNLSMFTNSNPVVIYVDGVPYYDRYDFDPSLANVEQVEILRGPQGTLYGKDAIGAVINIITKNPTNEWSGSIGAEYGSNNYMQSSFNTSGALIENKLYAGINGSFMSDDGWITNNYSGMDNDADKDKERKTSAFLLFQPTDKFSTKLIVTDNYSKTNWMDGLNTADITTPINSIKRKDVKNASFDVPTYEESRVKSQSLNLSYDFDDMKLESTTTHKKFDIDGDYDGDYVSGNLNDGLRMFNYTDMETYTQELKLSGKNQNIKWVAGLYVDDEERDIGPYGMETMSMGAVYVSDVYADANSKTQAIFGQTMIPLADKFELTLGGRYQKIKKDVDLTMYQTFGGVALPDFVYKDEKSWNTFLPKVALAYQNSDSLTTFASVSKGYMPGGFNYFASSGGTTENSFDPQKSTNYEVGMKYTGEDYLINASMFRMDIEDIHIYRVAGGGTIWLTDNAKKAHTQGIEIDGKYFLTDNIELSGAIGFIDAKYDDYDTGTTKYDGERIENTPKYTANIGIAYVADSGIYGRLDAFARGKTNYFDGANNTMVSADGAIISNLKIGYKVNTWDIYGYIKNITDEEYIDSFRSSSSGMQIVGFNEPRTFGIGARYKF